MSRPEHEHYWRRAFVKDGRGKTVIGRDCECGMQTIGGINANVLRASQRFNDGVTEALTNLARRMEEARRRRYEP